MIAVKPTGHGIYRNLGHAGNVLCQATKRTNFEEEGGDVHGAEPLGFLPYLADDGDDDKTNTIRQAFADEIERFEKDVAQAAADIVMRANETKMTDDGVRALIRGENERLFGIMFDSARTKFRRAGASLKPSRQRPSAVRQMASERRATKRTDKPAASAKGKKSKTKERSRKTA